MICKSGPMPCCSSCKPLDSWQMFPKACLSSILQNSHLQLCLMIGGRLPKSQCFKLSICCVVPWDNYSKQSGWQIYQEFLFHGDLFYCNEYVWFWERYRARVHKRCLLGLEYSDSIHLVNRTNEVLLLNNPMCSLCK